MSERDAKLIRRYLRTVALPGTKEETPAEFRARYRSYKRIFEGSDLKTRKKLRLAMDRALEAR